MVSAQNLGMRLTKQRVADAYQISRQYLYILCYRHRLDITDFLEPNIIFSKLLQSNRSQLRVRLIEQSTRNKIRQILNS